MILKHEQPIESVFTQLFNINENNIQKVSIYLSFINLRKILNFFLI